jgi:hypothetical protein
LCPCLKAPHTAARKYFLIGQFQIPITDGDDADKEPDKPSFSKSNARTSWTGLGKEPNTAGLRTKPLQSGPANGDGDALGRESLGAEHLAANVLNSPVENPPLMGPPRLLPFTQPMQWAPQFVAALKQAQTTTQVAKAFRASRRCHRIISYQ